MRNTCLSPRQPPINTFFPTTQCSLREGDVHCTSQEMTKLRNNWPTIQIQTYHTQRWQISTKQYQSMNWQAFEKTYRKISEPEKKFVVKLLSKWLPVGYNLNKYSSMKHNCPYCAQEETVYHLYQCTQNAQNGEVFFLTKLETYLIHLQTDTFLQIIILNMIRNGQQTPVHTTDPTPIWYLVMSGLIPTDWTMSQSKWMQTSHQPHGNFSGEKWTQQLSYWFIQQNYDHWQKRNKHLHKANTDQTNTTLQLHQHITTLYSMKSQLQPNDQKMFHLPLELRLTQPINVLKQWFTQTYNTTNKCIQQSKILLQQGQQDIRNYFQMNPKHTKDN